MKMFKDTLGALCIGKAWDSSVKEGDVTGIYDVASLTKPLLTAPLVLKILKAHNKSLDDPVETLPGACPFPFSHPTWRDCLNHTAGFSPWVPLASLAPACLVPTLLPALQISPPGKTLYSCLDYIYLAFTLTFLTRKSLKQLAYAMVLRDIPGVYFPLPRQLKSLTTPTEKTEKTQTRIGGKLPFRPMPIQGVVHDYNAYFLGGAHGNAGLFGNLEGIFRLALQAVPLKAVPLKPGSYVDGWRVGSSDSLIPPNCLGHTGFTGSMVLYHPPSGTVGVLLSHGLYHGIDEKKHQRERFITYFLDLL